jgi:uncharacterized protein (TIGR02453 family)
VTGFAGFPAETFDWFRGLEADNSKTWFDAHRSEYVRHVRGALEDMLETLADEYDGRVKLFRQHRDIRFSPDKSPYKTTTYGIIMDRPSSLAALYAQLSSSGLFCGTGYYQLEADQLTRMREAIADDRAGAKLERIMSGVREAGAETFGETLKTAPRSFPRDHPRIELLRHKMLVAGARAEPGARGIPGRKALDHARRVWDACEPMNAWLDEYVGAPGPRGARSS